MKWCKTTEIDEIAFLMKFLSDTLIGWTAQLVYPVFAAISKQKVAPFPNDEWLYHRLWFTLLQGWKSLDQQNSVASLALRIDRIKCTFKFLLESIPVCSLALLASASGKSLDKGRRRAKRSSRRGRERPPLFWCLSRPTFTRPLLLDKVTTTLHLAN